MSDPVHDDDAYAALRHRVNAEEMLLRRVQRERDAERLQRRLAAEEEAKRLHREELDAKYPSTVSAEIYEIAEQLVYDHERECADPKEIAEAYEHLVRIIDKTLASTRAEHARAMLSRPQDRS